MTNKHFGTITLDVVIKSQEELDYIKMHLDEDIKANLTLKPTDEETIHTEVLQVASAKWEDMDEF
jgi:hypothetical protein